MGASAGDGTSLPELRARLAEVARPDGRRLARRLDRARGLRDDAERHQAVDAVVAEVVEAEARIARRRAAVPAIRYPAVLPVSQRRDEIMAAIDANQVVIVAGETGSGKTTQIPKMCLELGRGVRGMIGHTQPRRLAARTVAARIAEELGDEIGGAVGYAVRFTDQVGDATLVKLMTDGILLAELQRDRQLLAYDTLIIDEAHERSLNIDFILGYLAQLLPRRPDLHVIVTSATIDPERFSRHFGGAPIIEVSGRTYPVELRYRPLGEAEAGGAPAGAGRSAVRDQVQGICDAVSELGAEPPGDILVFLSGEREIRDTAEALGAMGLPDTEVVPLYARLPLADQHRVFAAHPGRRIVLATNVAETSLTVPGIRYVVDPGTARISRYSNRLKVQRLPIEAVSQASADQRAGRCGRVADGICIRLYAEDDYDDRPAFTEPEMLRTNLASVILQMAAIGLGDIAAFPFIDPPDRRAITDGVRLLDELGALAPAGEDGHLRLTPLGRQLARLPVDPRFGRMVLEGDRRGCLREVLVVAAALSIQDPRERPPDKAGTADELHARFADPRSDFLAYLNLWRYVRERQRELSSGQFRRLCRNEMLNHLRIREWQDVHGQLRQVVASLGMSMGRDQAEPDQVHRALLAGLLSHIGLKDRDTREFRGPRGARFAIFPGSSLAKKPPRWVMAAELVETSRLWARTAARIEPEWAEELAAHLVTRSYGDPEWSPERGAAVVRERVTLYGLPIVNDRLVGYDKVDALEARELFIRHALVAGDWSGRHRFLAGNRAALAEVEELEHRYRRRDLVAGDEALFDLYDQRVGPNVVSGRAFDGWWRRARRRRPDLLTFTPAMLLDEVAKGLDESAFPERWHQGGIELDLTYRFEPGEPDDGVTVHVPVAVLNQVSADGFDWLVPGLREELVTTLVRSLPKPVRRHLTPVAEHVRAVLDQVRPDDGPLLDVLGRALADRTGVAVPRGAWDVAGLPSHLRATFQVEDTDGRALGRGDDLDALARALGGEVRRAIAGAGGGIERDDVRTWDFGELPRQVEREVRGHLVVGHPGLVDRGDHVSITLFDDPDERDRSMWAGARRLLLLAVPVSGRAVQRRLSNDAKLALGHSPHGSVVAVLADCIRAAADQLLVEAGGPPWDAVAFEELVSRAGDLEGRVALAAVRAAQVLTAARAIERRMGSLTNPAWGPSLDDIAAQLGGLVHPGFVAAAGPARLPDLLRYLRAVDRRLDKLPTAPARDRQLLAEVEGVQGAYLRLVDRLAPGEAPSAGLVEVRWMIEELRVSLFAQGLGTPSPVSVKRIVRALRALP